MNLKMTRTNNQGNQRFVSYEYGVDLFGSVYLDKFKGVERGKLISRWKLKDLGSLVRVLDLEIYKREMENYEVTQV
jgi:hypothetical protein